MNVIITGGAGYIGSHIVQYLYQKKINVSVIDNLSTGHQQSLPRIPLYIGDLSHQDWLNNVLKEAKPDIVIHLAACSEVEKSQKKKFFYQNNVINSIHLLESMKNCGINKIIFASSAAVYKNSPHLLEEHFNKTPANFYGETKLIVEEKIKEFAQKYKISYAILRYFNVAGACFSGQIGEDHTPETHLVPNIIKVCLGQEQKFRLFGINYPTQDGSAVRDYIHVLDVAEIHFILLQKLIQEQCMLEYNVGTGNGYSVKQIINFVKNVTKKEIIVEEYVKRIGDESSLIANINKIQKEINWKPQYGINDIINTAWQWHQKILMDTKNNAKTVFFILELQ